MLARWRRIFRHRWMDDAAVRRALPAAAQLRLTERVAASERLHTGQVRLCVEAGLPWSYLWRAADARERALTQFGKLRVWDTEHNNGVLIYLLLAERRIELVADRALARQVDAAQWSAIVQALSGSLHAGHVEQGLQDALDAVTALLVQHFPVAAGAAGANELPDAPVLG